MKIDYKFNNNTFRNYSVFVSSSNGIIGLPPRRINTFMYPGESGQGVDLEGSTYEERIITLDCFIKGASAEDLITKYNTFIQMLMLPKALTSLQVIVGTKTLTFQVYVDKISELIKHFTEGANVGTFTLTIVEPDTSIYQ